LILSWESGWTTAKPPDTVFHIMLLSMGRGRAGGFTVRGLLTEELLAASAFPDDIDYAGSELLNRWDMVGKNTHIAGFGGDVDLNTVT